MRKKSNLVIVPPLLVSLHSVTGKYHDVFARVVNARFVAPHFAVLAQQPILNFGEYK
jgi:hypothetical protein